TLGAPINVFLRLPYVGPATAKAEGLEAHRFKCYVAGQNKQVRPRKLAAVFLFDRPEQTTCLVEIAVVGPAVGGGETLLTVPGAAAAIADSVCARRVPCHADEEWSIVAVVRRPPFLRVGHQGMQVLDHCIEVERLELFRVIETLPHWIGK